MDYSLVQEVLVGCTMSNYTAAKDVAKIYYNLDSNASIATSRMRRTQRVLCMAERPHGCATTSYQAFRLLIHRRAERATVV